VKGGDRGMKEGKGTAVYKDFSGNRDVGLARVLRLKEIVEEAGKETGKKYEYWYNKNWNAGVDAIIYEVNEKGRLEVVAAIESTNYKRPNEYIDGEKFERYVRDLSFFGKYGAKMILLVSYIENLGRSERLREERKKILFEKGIYLIPLGGQDVYCEMCGKIIAAGEERVDIGDGKYLCPSCFIKEVEVRK